MIVDSSALVAIMKNEAGTADFIKALEESPVCRVSAANYLEAAVVVDKCGDPVIGLRFDQLMMRARIQIEPVTPEQARIARQAYKDFGRGSGHPARLNFGDCFAYALAVTTGEPILFKGDEFTKAGLRSALRKAIR